MSNILNNQTEFVLSQDLAGGFTVLNNNILNCGLSFNAIGLYSTIIQKAYIPGWKVYQATLINQINKKAAVSNGIKELIEFGLIIKEQLRENGRIKGIKYIITATPTRQKDYVTGEFANNVEHVENTSFSPKAEKQISVIQTSVKRPLINKDTKKRKTLKKKDNTTTKEKDNIKNNSSSSEIDSKNYKITLDIKAVTKMNIKRNKLTVEQLELLEQYVLLQDNIDNLDKFSCYIAKQIKAGAITKDDLINTQNKKPVITFNKKNEIKNFEETKDKFLQDAANVEKEWLEDFSI